MGENAMKILYKHGLGFMFFLGLTACGSTPETPVTGPAPQTPAYHPPAAYKPAPPPVTYKPVTNDQCGATALQGLVGKPRTEITVPLDPGKRRVVCSSCIVTQEYRSDRQTIVFSSETGIIESVKCG